MKTVNVNFPQRRMGEGIDVLGEEEWLIRKTPCMQACSEMAGYYLGIGSPKISKDLIWYLR